MHVHAQERAEQRDRDHQRRDQRGAEVLQEDQHHQEHQHDRFGQRLDHFLDRDAARRSSCRTARTTSTPCGKRRLQLVHARLAPPARRRARWRRARAAPRTRPVGCAVPLQVEAVALTRRISTRATSFRRTVVPSLLARRMMLLELLGRAEAAFGRHRRGEPLRLPATARAPTEPAANCTFCPRTAASTCGRRQAVTLQLVRVEPDVHRVFAAEQLRAADAGNARDLVEHARGDEVGQRVAVDAPGCSTAARPPSGSRRWPWPPTTPCCVDFGRQSRRGQRDLVLHLHLRDVGIGAGLEGQGDRRAAARSWTRS